MTSRSLYQNRLDLNQHIDLQPIANKTLEYLMPRDGMRNYSVLVARNIWVTGALVGLFAVFALRLPPFAILSSGLVVMVTLREGWLKGVRVMLTGGIIIAAVWFWRGSPTPWLALPLVFALWPPLLVMATLLHRGSASLGHCLLMTGMVMVAFVLLMHTLTDDVVGFWQEWLRRTLAEIPVPPKFKQVGDTNTIQLINGFVGLIYGLSLFLALLLGRWLHCLAEQSRGFGQEFRRLTVPIWILPLAVALIWAAGLWDPVLLTDLLMVAILIYFFVGLAVIHGVIAVRGLSPVWLLPPYLMITFFPPEALATLALIGAIDPFIHFRDQQGT